MKVFGTCGVINLAKIATEGMGLKADAGLLVGTGSPLGTRFGFVEFQTRQGAEAATKLDGILLGGRPIRVGPSNGPIIQPTAYGPGAATMRNRPPLYKVSAVGVTKGDERQGGFVILDEKAEESINKRIDSRVGAEGGMCDARWSRCWRGCRRRSPTSRTTRLPLRCLPKRQQPRQLRQPLRLQRLQRLQRHLQLRRLLPKERRRIAMSIMVITTVREVIESGVAVDESGVAVPDIIQAIITPPVTAEVTAVRRDTTGINLLTVCCESHE